MEKDIFNNILPIIIFKETQEINGENIDIIMTDMNYRDLFKKDELIKIKNLIDNTIKLYENLNIDDDFIKKRTIDNHNIFNEKYLNKSNKIEEKIISGFIYVIKNNNTGFYKIGRTLSIEKRFNKLSKDFGDIELYFYYKADDYILEEKNMHQKYKEYRRYGEWFELNEVLLNEIKNKCNGTPL